MSKIINQTSNLQVTSRTSSVQAKGAIANTIPQPRLQENSSPVSSRLAIALQLPVQKQKPSRKAAAKISNDIPKLESTAAQQLSPTSPLTQTTFGNEPRNPNQVISPFDSDDNNAELWKMMS